MDNTQVKEVGIDQEGVRLHTDKSITINSDLLIGCDGAQGFLSRALTGTQLDHNHHAAAVRAYFKNVASITDSAIELHFIKELLPSYLWIFPLPGNLANVGLGLLSKTAVETKFNLRKRLHEIIKDHPNLRRRFQNAQLVSEIKGFGLPLGSRRVAMSGDRFMLCGDATSLIDPFSGEGIGQAMVSGRYAGWQAIKCFETNDFSGKHLRAYDKTVYQKLWKTNRNHYIIQKLVGKRAWLANFLVHHISENSTINKLAQKLIW
jgi:flavin-dependent dehydrogenase